MGNEVKPVSALFEFFEVQIGNRLGRVAWFVIDSIDGERFHGQVRLADTEAGQGVWVSRAGLPHYTQEAVLAFPEDNGLVDLHDDHTVRNLVLAGLTIGAAAALVGVAFRHRQKPEGPSAS